MKKLCIIGDVLIDYTLQHGTEDKMRHGGIIHAARGAWALEIEYSLFYFAPNYLDKSIRDFCESQDGRFSKIGNVNGCPNLILIKEAKETGHQGYEMILRDGKMYEYNLDALASAVASNEFSDYLIFSGGYDLSAILKILSKAKAKIYVDISNDIQNTEVLASLGKKFTGVYLSTSSYLFLKFYHGDIQNLTNGLSIFSDNLVFKENRGGSRFIDFKGQPVFIPSQTKPIVHSVGVGDNFDVAHLWARYDWAEEDAMCFASWMAAEYASTTYVDDFKKGVQRTIAIGIDQLKGFGGVNLPWELRPGINIYIAAPDFNHINTEAIRKLESSLRYHNFTPRLPIEEHGQLDVNASKVLKSETCFKDIELLQSCQIAIGVLVFDDPGTLIEIGYAIAKGIPTFVYDPYDKAKNCILECLPSRVSSNLDIIISEVFNHASKIRK